MFTAAYPPRRPGKMGAVAWSALLVTIAMLRGSPARAQVFSPIKPTTCPTEVSVSFKYNVGGASSPIWDLPNALPQGVPTQYQNNLDHARNYITNAWTTRARLFVSEFNTEPGVDSLQFSSPQSSGSLSGAVPPSSYVTLQSSLSLQTNVATTRFVTNAASGQTGFKMNGARLCTTRSTIDTSAVPIVRPDDRTQGALLGTNDVVYTAVNPNVLGLPSNTHLTVSLWNEAAGSVNFNVYTRCGALPTPTTYNHAGLSSDAQEFVHVTTACSQPTYIAIHSQSGAGGFNLVVGTHKAASDYPVITAGVESPVDSATRTTISNALRDASRLLFGATEGDVLMQNIHLYNNSYCSCAGGFNNCNVCFRLMGPPSTSEICYKQWPVTPVRIAQVHWGDARIITHELLHNFYCARDEYGCTDGSNPCPPEKLKSCGHSMMDVHWDPNQNNVCTSLDHNLDKWVGRLANSTNGPAHDQAYSAGVQDWAQSYITYDNWPYTAFDFNGLIGTVILQ